MPKRRRATNTPAVTDPAAEISHLAELHEHGEAAELMPDHDNILGMVRYASQHFKEVANSSHLQHALSRLRILEHVQRVVAVERLKAIDQAREAEPTNATLHAIGEILGIATPGGVINFRKREWVALTSPIHVRVPKSAGQIEAEMAREARAAARRNKTVTRAHSDVVDAARRVLHCQEELLLDEECRDWLEDLQNLLSSESPGVERQSALAAVLRLTLQAIHSHAEEIQQRPATTSRGEDTLRVAHQASRI